MKWGLLTSRCGSSVEAVDLAVGEGGDGGAGEFRNQIHAELGEGLEAHDEDAEADGGVEGAAGNAADGDRADEDGEADGEAVEGVAHGGLGGGGVEDDPAQGEGEEELDDEGAEARVSGDDGGIDAAFEENVDETGGGGAGDELRNPIREDVFLVAAAAEKGGEGDGGVEVSAGDVAAGEDHDHEDRTDGDGGEGRALADSEADGEHEEERADELDDVFFHGVG